MTARRVTIPHISALDGLRGVAVIGVLLFHGEHLKGGFLGVDLFFVLSGFLITSLLLAEHRGADTIALGAFWARRARRLLPALALMLFGVILYTALYADPTALSNIRDDALSTVGYVANWRSVFAHQSYFNLFIARSPLEHTWSLAIEEQFYVVWPLVVVGVARFTRRRPIAPTIFAVAVVLDVGSFALMTALYNPQNTARVYFGTDTRAGALFAGIAVAAAIATWGHLRGTFARVALEGAACAAILGMAALWSQLHGEAPRLYHGGFVAAALGAAVIIMAAVHPRRGPIAIALSFAPFRWLGIISYGLYLWHWPVDVFLDGDRAGVSGWPLFALRTAVALAIAIASYVWVERPIRRGAIAGRQWRWVTPAIAGVLVVAIFAVTAGAKGLPIPKDDTGRAKPGGVLVVGDSVSRTVAPGLDRAGFDVTNDGINGCRLLRGVVHEFIQTASCPWLRLWRREVKVLQPKAVVLVQGAFELSDIRPPGSPSVFVPGSLFWANYYYAMLKQVVDVLSADGAKVVLPLIPCFGQVGAGAAFAKSGAFDVDRVRAANRVIQLLASRDRRIIAPDLFGFLCPQGVYVANLGGVKIVRFDGTHFSAAGSDLVAKFLAPFVAKGMERP
jgi:Predicted acyltransferases